MDDLTLFKRFAAGDAEAAAAVVHEYAGGLILFVYGIIKDTHASEDIVEDCFAALMGGRGDFKGEAAFKTYLYRSAKHRAFNYLRLSKRGVPLEQAEQTAELTSLEDAYIKKERDAALYRALEDLSPDYRVVLQLIYFEDMSYAQAAEVMGKKEAQIKNLAFRARAALRELLIKEGFTYED